ncbi:hypothetical protein EI94DRAFT_97949 [Lactarius quietus]|nr:hypothetical protein EI94DRAFT_97949 [Lactarius quietus]
MFKGGYAEFLASQPALSPIAIITMTSDLFPFSPPESRTIINTRRWRSFLRSNGTVKIGFFFTTFFLTGLIVYLTILSPNALILDWHLPPVYSDSRTLVSHNETPLLIQLAPLYYPLLRQSQPSRMTHLRLRLHRRYPMSSLSNRSETSWLPPEVFFLETFPGSRLE